MKPFFDDPDYLLYVTKVSKDERSDCMARTPDKMRKYSRNSWDKIVKNWKLQVHSAAKREIIKECVYVCKLIPVILMYN